MELKKIKRRIKNPPLKNFFEMSVWKTLKEMLKKYRGSTVSYESEKIPYTLQKSYTPDFILKKPNGEKIYIEAKGYLRPEDRTKLLAVVRDNPGIDLRILFKQNNPLIKGSNSKYSDWAEKNNLPYAIGEVPPEWLKNK